MKLDLSELEAQVELDKETLKTARDESVMEPSVPVDEPADEPGDKPADDGGDDKTAEDSEKPEDNQDSDDAPKKAEPEMDKRARIEKRRAEKKALDLQREEALRAAQIENARLKGIQEARQAETKKFEEHADPEPDRDIDPEAHSDWRYRQLEKRDAEREEKYKALETKTRVSEAENYWISKDREMAAANPVYGESVKYLRDTLRSSLKEAYPAATAQQIEQAAKSAEYGYVAKLATPELIESFFVGEAMKMGFNPHAKKESSKQAVDDKPKTDPKELAFHKKNAGSLVSVSDTGGKGRISSTDLAKMSTKEDLFDLGNLKDSDWKRIVADQQRKDARG